MKTMRVRTTTTSNLAELVSLRKNRLQKKLTYYFVGIGGCGMSALALMLVRQGHKVSGSDMVSSPVVERLGRRGIHVHIGHRAESVPAGVDCVVASAAVKDDNPELLQAKKLGVKVLKYAQMLGELTRSMKTVAVAGTHGKSTTSGWLAYMLKKAGFDPSFVIGADVEQLGGPSGSGSGEYLVVEACEYDRSFLNFYPQTAAILNIEPDHLDYYRDLEEIIQSFGQFAARLPADGLLVANGADANVRRALEGKHINCEFFRLDGQADWQAVDLEFDYGQASFELWYKGTRLRRVSLSLAGGHNVANALAAAALARQVGLSDQQICTGLEGFVGVSRRMSYKGEVDGVVVLDDYAHHPTEIRVTLQAVRQMYQPRCLWCVFQPHQHSRTRFLLDDFAGSFGEADVVLLPDIYFVRDSEASRREITAAMLAERIALGHGRAYYLESFNRIVEHLVEQAKSGDVVITMGAGDIWKLADELIRRLRRDS